MQPVDLLTLMVGCDETGLTEIRDPHQVTDPRSASDVTSMWWSRVPMRTSMTPADGVAAAAQRRPLAQTARVRHVDRVETNAPADEDVGDERHEPGHGGTHTSPEEQ